MDSINSIKKNLTDTYISNEVIINKYNLDVNKTFDEQFSKVSIESILFYVVAYIIYLREKAHELWQSDVEATALETRYGTKQWWHKVALMWQYGDEIKVTENATLEYDTIDTTKQIVKYCAVVATGRTVYLRVAKKIGEDLAKLTDEEIISFKRYLNEMKPLGIRVVGESLNACSLSIYGNIYYNAEKEKNELETNIQTAIKDYLSSITFGGIIFTSKITDAIQAVEGVTDVSINIMGYDNGTTINVHRAYQAKSGYYSVGGWGFVMQVEENIN
jgi:hypothetical protein